MRLVKDNSKGNELKEKTSLSNKLLNFLIVMIIIFSLVVTIWIIYFNEMRVSNEFDVPVDVHLEINDYICTDKNIDGRNVIYRFGGFKEEDYIIIYEARSTTGGIDALKVGTPRAIPHYVTEGSIVYLNNHEVIVNKIHEYSIDVTVKKR